MEAEDHLTVGIVVAAPNEGNGGVSRVDSIKAPPVAQATKAMRSTLPQCIVVRLSRSRTHLRVVPRLTLRSDAKIPSKVNR